MKKVLVLVADYPNLNGGVALMYVHVRNKYYIQHGIDVTVLNFKAEENYEIDNIKVITLNSYETMNVQYNTLILHAANIRNHYRFLKKYDSQFKHIVFFFHGHEVLRLNETYPTPYEYTKKDTILRKVFQNCYDTYKLQIWHNYLPKVADKADYIFVSNWFYHEFEKYVKLTKKELKGHVHIINNSVGEIFEKETYQYSGKKEFDFISIRSYMDASKYCMDIINNLAEKNPQFKFLVIGKGDFYKLNKKPDNVFWLEKFLNHEELLSYIEKAHCALLPTRLDAQGVMTCEVATYGIPVITSNLEVCKEVLGNLHNVAYIDNEHLEDIDLPKIYNELISRAPFEKITRFNYEHTVKLEERLFVRGGGMTS